MNGMTPESNRDHGKASEFKFRLQKSAHVHPLFYTFGYKGREDSLVERTISRALGEDPFSRSLWQ